MFAHAGEWRGLEVAIKTIVFESGVEDNQTARVASEAAIASNLVHSNVVSTYSHSIASVGDRVGNELEVFKFYLIQEFCNGGSLRQALQRQYFTDARLKDRWTPVTSVLISITQGMSYIHAKRICHGDLNPSNVLFKFSPAECKSVKVAIRKNLVLPKIIDFGMAMRMCVPPGLTTLVIESQYCVAQRCAAACCDCALMWCHGATTVLHAIPSSGKSAETLQRATCKSALVLQGPGGEPRKQCEARDAVLRCARGAPRSPPLARQRRLLLRRDDVGARHGRLHLRRVVRHLKLALLPQRICI